ncbi:MAG: HipA domain-containing protein [Coriobacteriales bacterium]|jgi:serine/threonine-protein kinase HipA|nr:HipA domain-containing protein [Coriobacteriales bacterium]
MSEIYEVFLDTIDGITMAGELLVSRNRNVFNVPHFQFTYSEQYLASASSFALSTDLPLKRDVFRGWSADREMLGAFADAMPDRWGKRLIERKVGATRLADIDYLLNVPDFTRQGALRISGDGGKSFLGSDFSCVGIDELSEIHQTIQRYVAGKANEADVNKMIFTGSQTNGGQFPKTVLVDDDGDLCIAKFQGDEQLASPHWEAACLAMARDAGIEVPNFCHYWLDDISILVEKRFDRLRQTATTNNYSGQQRQTTTPDTCAGKKQSCDCGVLQSNCDSHNRVPYMSAETFMMLPSNPIFITPYTVFAQKLHRQISPVESRKLFDRVAFLLMVNNTDDHWKNHGLLHIKGQWELAPLFDVNPTTSPDPYDLPQLTGRMEVKRSLASLLASADAYGMKEAKAKESIERIAAIVRQWRSYAERYARSEAEIEQREAAFTMWER